MKRAFILILSFLFLTIEAFSYELVLPIERKNVVTTNYALFVGKVNGGENLTINDTPIYTASNGAFAHSIKLKNGNNRIILRSNYNTKIFSFCKINASPKKDEPIQEFELKHAVVIKDNTPLRSTPVDAGLNRIGHLYEGTTLLINGEKNDFYRVFLSDKKVGWISKNHINFVEQTEWEPAKFISMNSENYKNASIQIIEFSKKLPYTVEEKDKEVLFKIYNPELSGESVYSLNLPKPEKYTYSVNLDKGKYTFKVKKMPKKLKEYTVVIDAGHGGSEKGAVGCLGDLEKDINLKIAEELKNILSEMGINAIMTRECDGELGLYDRTKIAIDNNAEIFVSIHLNSIPDICMNIHHNRGTSVYYYNKNSKLLAECVEKSLVHKIGTRKDGIKTASFAVIRPPEYAGILVETAYMTNPLDSLIYTKDSFAKDSAQGIANGIKQYINHK